MAETDVPLSGVVTARAREAKDATTKRAGAGERSTSEEFSQETRLWEAPFHPSGHCSGIRLEFDMPRTMRLSAASGGRTEVHEEEAPHW